MDLILMPRKHIMNTNCDISFAAVRFGLRGAAFWAQYLPKLTVFSLRQKSRWLFSDSIDGLLTYTFAANRKY